MWEQPLLDKDVVCSPSLHFINFFTVDMWMEWKDR